MSAVTSSTLAPGSPVRLGRSRGTGPELRGGWVFFVFGGVVGPWERLLFGAGPLRAAPPLG